jgi:V-type H+-transporting ATPase S1 subunit
VSGKQAVDKFADMKFFFNEHVLVALTNASYDNTPLDMASVTVTANDSATNKNQIDAGLKIGDHQIIFNFVLSGGSWEARDITVDGARFVSNVPIDAYGGKSFGCGNVMLTNLQHSLVLNGFQIQPAYDGAEIQKFTADAIFGAHNDCVGFFSPVIWGALFVVFLLLFILSYGFTMIMDIKTMDRFDDPKGKTITINAQE